MALTKPFDTHCDEYDAWFDRHHDLYEAELDAIRRLMPPPPTRMLEVGVGSGKFAVPLGIDIGIEPSKTMVTRAYQKGIRVCRAGAEKLPFSDGVFDCVLMVTTICFLDDVQEAFTEIFRVLKPQGCCLIGFVDKDSELGKIYVEKQKTSIFYHHAVFYSARDVGAVIRNAGFGNVVYLQTLLPGEFNQQVRNGFGDGGFVVARGTKGRFR
ncbi:class I SAM-dependent methyltransferase [bacterium]|nr:class I SAM-dependent methyltransferase [candidate division CSSED10-310 bacterium]